MAPANRDDSEDSDDQGEPLHLRPSDKPWRPTMGRKTHVIAWIILIGMMIVIVGMLAAILAGP